MDETVNDDGIIESLEPMESSVANGPQEGEAQNGGNSAVEEASEQATSNEVAEDKPADSTKETQTGDANIKDFLAKKGIDPSDPEALGKVATMYQNVEKGFYQKSQEKAQLERQLTAQRYQAPDPTEELQSRVNAMQTEMDTERWKQANHITPDVEAKMVEYISQPILDRNGQPLTGYNGQALTKANLVLTGALTLDEVYRMVGGGQEDANSVKEEMQKAIQSEMAAKQIAKRPTAGTTNSSQFATAEPSDPFLEGFLSD